MTTVVVKNAWHRNSICMATDRPKISDSHSTERNDLRLIDQEVLLVLRRHDSMSVGDLTKALGVTATAIRQRIERLLQTDLVLREKVVSGRGRPTFRYRISDDGLRQTSADTTRLAEAMWQEIISVPDKDLRHQMLRSLAARLGQQMAVDMRPIGDSQESSFEERMQQFSQNLAARKMDTAVKKLGGLPVLDIGTCPYPSLTGLSDDRAMCRMEEQMISEALGQDVKLSSCRLDGDDCCQFSAVNQTS